MLSQRNPLKLPMKDEKYYRKIDKKEQQKSDVEKQLQINLLSL